MAIDKVNSGAVGNPTGNVKKKIITTKQLASIFYKLADENSSAVSMAEFQKRLKSLNKNNIVSFIKAYDNLNTGESFIEMIGDEVGDDSNLRKQTILSVFNLLIEKAKEYKIDVKYYEKEFNKALDKEFNGWTWNGINASRLDDIVNTLICNIEAQSNLTKDEKQKIETTPTNVAHVKATNVFINRLNSAIRAFEKQMKEDGWAGDIADFFGKLGKNNADDVRKDFNKCKEYAQRLKDVRAFEETGKSVPNSKNKFKTYAEEFKDIFGVDYNPSNIVAYQKTEKEYIEVMTKNDIANNFKNKFSRLLRDDVLNEEYTTMISPTTGCGTQVLSKTKEQVYKEDFEAVANSINPKDGKTILEGMLKEAGLEKASIDEKYKALHLLVDIQYKRMKDDLKTSLKGQTVEQVEAKYQYSYKAAFGLDNDIMKRVIDYNVSQQKGAGIVKGAVIGGVVLGATVSAIASGGTSLLATSPILAGMGLTAGVTAGVELSDTLSKPRVQEAFKTGGFKEGVKAMDLENIVVSSLMAGAFAGVMGGMGKGVQVITSSLKFTPTAQIATAFGADVAMGVGTEYVLTGEVSIEGVVFTVLISASGTLLGMKAVKGQEAKLRTELNNARNTLGIAQGAEITDDILRRALISKGNLLKTGDSEGLIAVQKAYNLLKTQTVSKSAGISEPVSKAQTQKPKTSSNNSKKSIQSREALKAKLQKGGKVITSKEKDIHIPKGKLAAPSAKFAETDDAFQTMIQKNKFKILLMQAEYRITGNKENYLNSLYRLICKEMDIENVPLRIVNNPNTNDGGAFSPASREVEININYNGDPIEQITHELNHFLQIKEQLITGNGVDIVANNDAVQLTRMDIQAGEVTTQAEVNQRFNDYYRVGREGYSTDYSDVLNGTRYPKNTDPNDYYFQKANKYNQADIDYVNAHDDYAGYRNNYKEVESFRRGQLCAKTISESPEKQVIDAILESVPNVDETTKLALIDVAIEEMQKDRYSNYTAQKFITEFFQKYLVFN